MRTAADAAAAERVYDSGRSAEASVTVDGKTYDRLAINGTIPAPCCASPKATTRSASPIRRDEAPTSPHWAHGLKLPGLMDGVTGFNGYPGIAPGETFTYRFKIRQSGTYWYSFAYRAAGAGRDLCPAGDRAESGETVKTERDYVEMLSDIHPERGMRILRNLKVDPGYYNYGKRTLGDFFRDVDKKGLSAALKDRAEWARCG